MHTAFKKRLLILKAQTQLNPMEKRIINAAKKGKKMTFELFISLHHHKSYDTKIRRLFSSELNELFLLM